MAEARPHDEDTLAASSPTPFTAATAPYSITSSARPSSDTGTSMPSAFAVFEVDYQLDLGDLLHREVGGLFALQDATRIDAREAIGIGVEAAIADQAAIVGELAIKIHRRQGMGGTAQGDELGSPSVEDRVGGEGDRADPLRRRNFANAVSISCSLLAHWRTIEFRNPECLGCRPAHPRSPTGTQGFSG